MNLGGGDRLVANDARRGYLGAVVGSNAAKHPGWYRELAAAPEVESVRKLVESHAAALGSPVARRLNSRYLGVLVSVWAWSIRARFARQGCRPLR